MLFAIKEKGYCDCSRLSVLRHCEREEKCSTACRREYNRNAKQRIKEGGGGGGTSSIAVEHAKLTDLEGREGGLGPALEVGGRVTELTGITGPHRKSGLEQKRKGQVTFNVGGMADSVLS